MRFIQINRWFFFMISSTYFTIGFCFVIVTVKISFSFCYIRK